MHEKSAGKTTEIDGGSEFKTQIISFSQEVENYTVVVKNHPEDMKGWETNQFGFKLDHNLINPASRPS
jgi:hypothetical protein